METFRSRRAWNTGGVALGMLDPLGVTGAEETILRAFRETGTMLSRLLDLLLALLGAKLGRCRR